MVLVWEQYIYVERCTEVAKRHELTKVFLAGTIMVLLQHLNCNVTKSHGCLLIQGLLLGRACKTRTMHTETVYPCNTGKG